VPLESDQVSTPSHKKKKGKKEMARRRKKGAAGKTSRGGEATRYVHLQFLREGKRKERKGCITGSSRSDKVTSQEKNQKKKKGLRKKKKKKKKKKDERDLQRKRLLSPVIVADSVLSFMPLEEKRERNL